MNANFGSSSLYVGSRSTVPFPKKGPIAVAISNQALQPGYYVSFVDAKKFKDAEGAEPCLPGDEVRLVICENGMEFRCSGNVTLLPDDGLGMGPNSFTRGIQG